VPAAFRSLYGSIPILPPGRILETLTAVGKALSRDRPGWRGVYSFVDAFSGLPKAAEEFRAMAARGLRRVYLGMESGCDEILCLLNKPATTAEALALVRALKAGGVQVGVIVMLGIGGERFAARHQEETLAAVEAMGLGRCDVRAEYACTHLRWVPVGRVPIQGMGGGALHLGLFEQPVRERVLQQSVSPEDSRVLS